MYEIGQSNKNDELFSRVCDIELSKDHLAKNSLELLIDPFLDFLTGAMEEMTEIKILL